MPLILVVSEIIILAKYVIIKPYSGFVYLKFCLTNHETESDIIYLYPLKVQLKKNSFRSNLFVLNPFF